MKKPSPADNESFGLNGFQFRSESRQEESYKNKGAAESNANEAQSRGQTQYVIYLLIIKQTSNAFCHSSLEKHDLWYASKRSYRLHSWSGRRSLEPEQPSEQAMQHHRV
jgi:hypothetical protein